MATQSLTFMESLSFKKALEFALKWEGSLSNHPADLGGLTNFGIIQTNYQAWPHRQSDCVSKITQTEVQQFYWEEVWQKAECDRLLMPLAITHFDTAVNFGDWGATQFLAEALGIPLDSKSPRSKTDFKRLTLGLVEEIQSTSEARNLAVKYCQGRIAYRHQRVKKNSSQEVFLQGWLNRDKDLQKFIETLDVSLALRIIQPTVIKLKPIQSSELPDSEKVQVPEPRVLSINSYQRVRSHIRAFVNPDDEPFRGKPIWYVFEGHCEVYESPNDLTSGTTLVCPAPPKQVKLDVPFKSQLDNDYNPTGSCNVTSLAMCLEYFKAQRNPQYSRFEQFEDELYQYCLDRGYSRHNPYHLAEVIRDYGCNSRFTEYALIEQVKDWLNVGNPCIIHGYFTSFGHIVVAVGYDEKGLIIHDPYGEWFPTGYRTDLSGAFLHYSYGLIKKTCIPDGSFWVHFVSP